MKNLLHIARQGVPFTSGDGQAFVRLPDQSGVPVRSTAFSHWFFDRFFTEYDTIPTTRAFHAILRHLEARAGRNQSLLRPAVFRRVGAHGLGPIPSHILLDLADPGRRVVEISPAAWKIATLAADTIFQSSPSSLSLPDPVPQPDALDVLRSCLNLSSRADWLRCLAWLLSTLHPHGPFPFLVLQGPPCSGKSIAARILRSVVDPHAVPLAPTPVTIRDVLTTAGCNWILALDHISTLSPPLSGALCRISSGVGLAASDHAQYLKRPVLLTVTQDWSAPPDLAQRALTVTCPAFSPRSCRTEADLFITFQQAWPGILAALCTAAATALDRLPQTGLPGGRCADALAWAVAASPALDCTEDEMRRAFAPPPPPHPVVDAVTTLMRHRRSWAGSATELLRVLRSVILCRTPKGLSQQLRSCALTLADRGIELKFRRKHTGVRILELHSERGDASHEKRPPDASPVFAHSPQPVESTGFPHA